MTSNWNFVYSRLVTFFEDDMSPLLFPGNIIIINISDLLVKILKPL
jgi:hypothetical protein